MRTPRRFSFGLLLAALAALLAPFAPAVEQSIEFTGATAFSEKDLRAALIEPFEAIEREGLTPATSDDAAFFLELYYRKHGYPRALVTHTILGGKRLRLAVSEGASVKLGKVTFIGAKSLPEERLRLYFLAPTRSRVESDKVELPYIESDLRAGLETVRDLYLSEGFLDVQTPALAPRVSATTADVTVTIREGRRYRFGAVRLLGLPEAEPVRKISWWRRKLTRKPTRTPREQLDVDLAEIAREPYAPAAAQAMAGKVQTYLKGRGYYAAETSVRPAGLRGTTVPVVIVAKPGPVYRFGDVTVKGTDRLKPRYVQNRFGVLTGQTFSPVTLDAVFTEQMRTGLFSSLRIAPAPQPDGSLRLDITVQEAKAREFGASVGYSTFDGPLFGIELRDRNLLGSGRPITFRADYSARTVSTEILYEDPHWLETDFKLRLRLQLAGRDLDSYKKREAGLLVELSRKLTKEFEVSAFMQARKVKITTINVSPAAAGLRDYVVPSVGLTAALDFRDSPIIPARGLAANAAVEFAPSALGGDLDFLRVTSRLTYYIPIGKTTLALGARAGLVRPLGGSRSDVPIDERFFSGGSTTVRSFAERKLGPRDAVTGKPTGGLAFTTLNAEYTFPIRGDLSGAVFYDAGNLARDLGFSGFRQGIGAGIRYNLPIGPLRIDYGFNPSRKSGESTGALHIAFGVAF